jgi:hypothetical protein
MTQSVRRETLVQATRDLPELQITEVVLQTARWQEMNDWYSAFVVCVAQDLRERGQALRYCADATIQSVAS